MSEDTRSQPDASTLNPKLVRELADILNETGLAEMEVTHGELKLRLSRAGGVTIAAMPAPVAAPAAATVPAALPKPVEPEARAEDLRNHPGAVTSPMVGTAYLSPEPGKPAFVKIGDSVREGQTLLVVEAMKTFNPIPAPRAGKVARIVVSDSAPVEFGQPLLILE